MKRYPDENSSVFNFLREAWSQSELLQDCRFPKARFGCTCARQSANSALQRYIRQWQGPVSLRLSKSEAEDHLFRATVAVLP
jgi:hypothetical protein